MGDIADAIINGDMDSETGEWIGGGQGFPRTTSRSSRPPAYPKGHMGGRRPKDTECKVCGKKMRGDEGLRTHTKAVHTHQNKDR